MALRKAINERAQRTLRLELRDNTEAGEHSVELSFSSENPVSRGWYTEILSHSPECIRVGERQQHMPLLFNHNPNDLLGVVERAWLGEDRRQHAVVRFAQDERGKWAEQMVRDGILTNVSFQYQIYDYREEAKDVFRAIDWEVFEISLVTVPADESVGVNRSDPGKVAPEPKSDESAREAQKEETKNMYQTLKKDASNDATKRGLARSSIVINILDAFDQNMIDEINKINEEISTKVESLNNQKSLLSEQRQNALNAFDISYAVELSTKIDEINEKLAEEEQKVIEYNNQIAEKEAEYESKRNQDTLDRAEFIEKYGEDAIQNLKQDEKFEIALNYLNKLSKSEALSELETNRTYSYELGPTNYNRLKILINQRSE